MTWVARAAANNAAWCDAVCRTHGISGRFDPRAWSAPSRTPPFYPDAVTLAEDVTASEVLELVDHSPGCSIKDSFAVLDLSNRGFEVLIDGQWIVRLPMRRAHGGASMGPGWRVVDDVATFDRWADAWRDGNGPADIIRSAVLQEDDVRVLLAETDGAVSAGAILNETAGLVGLSNFFVRSGDAGEELGACIAATEALFPGSPVVGYEDRDGLELARAHGFEVAGPLRVWSNKPTTS